MNINAIGVLYITLNDGDESVLFLRATAIVVKLLNIEYKRKTFLFIILCDVKHLEQRNVYPCKVVISNYV